MRPSIRRTILKITAATVVGVACATAFAAPALADVELYKDEYFQGSSGWWVGDNYDYFGDAFSDGAGLNDEVTSINNWISSKTCFFTDYGYSGNKLGLPSYNAQVNIGSVYSDEISSHDAYNPSC